MTLLVWLLAAGSALFWGLRLFVAAPPLPQRTPVASAGPVVRADLTRLLGVDSSPPVAQVAAEPAPDARFQLIGVVAPRNAAAAREGLALIAVDGKPAKAYRVGAVVDGENVLKSVAARGATLGPRDGAALVALNIAPPPPAATGILPSMRPATLQPQQAPTQFQVPPMPTGTPQPQSAPMQLQAQPMPTATPTAPPVPMPVQGRLPLGGRHPNLTRGASAGQQISPDATQ